jgi:hypothetical protein
MPPSLKTRMSSLGSRLLEIAPAARTSHLNKLNPWTVGVKRAILYRFPHMTSENEGDRDAEARLRGFQLNFERRRSSSILKPHRTSIGEGKAHAFSRCVAHAQTKKPVPSMRRRDDSCRDYPHPVHANFEIHGYLCDRCVPINSLIVLRSPPLQSMM